MKVNIGSGSQKMEGFLALDMSDKCGADIVADITEIPWKWATEPIEYLRADNIMEHLYPEQLIAVINEAHDKMAQGGVFWIRVPLLTHEPDNIYRAFTDPTHKNYFTEGTFDYWEDKKNRAGINRWQQFGKDYGIKPWRRQRQEVWNKTFLIVELVKE